MKGIIFNLLEEIVREEQGEEVWDGLLASAGLDGVYTSLGNYPDEHLTRLVEAAAAALGLPAGEVVRWAGRQASPRFARRYPQFYAAHAGSRSFLLTLNDIIHPQVRMLYPGAQTPEFEYDTRDPDGLTMIYLSPRRLCAFALGMIEGTAEHYGESLDLAETHCMHRGDARCEFHLRFERA